MKKSLNKLLFSTVLFLGLGVATTGNSQSSDATFKPPSKQDRIDLAMEQEFEMTKDLSTNEVPRTLLLNAIEQSEKLKAELAKLKNTNIFWKERGPKNVGGRTRALIFDQTDESGNTVFAGAVSGGIWKCQNFLAGTNEWHKLHEGFENISITSIVQDKNSSQVLYAGTGEGFFGLKGIKGLGIWKSTNKGNSWENLAYAQKFSYIQKLAIDKNGHLYAATLEHGIQKSTNGGASFSKVLGISKQSYTDHMSDLEITSNGHIYASAGVKQEGGLYKSTNNGSTWTKLTNGLPSTDVGRVEISSSQNNPNVLYVLIEKLSDGSCLGIYTTKNAGQSWSSLPLPKAYGMNNFCRNQAWYDMALGIDPKDANHLLLGGIDLFKSNDGGATWSQISQWYGKSPYQYVHADQHTIAFHPTKNNIVAIGNDGGIWHTTNSQSYVPRITDRNNGYNVTQFYTIAAKPNAGDNYILAGAQDNGTQRFLSTGINETEDIGGGDGAFTHIDKNNPNVQIISNIFSNYQVSTNGGQSFTFRNFGGDGLFINPTYYDSKAKKMYAGHMAGHYLRWENPSIGGYQHEVVLVANMQGMISAIKISPTENNRLYIGTNQGDIFRIDDAHEQSFREAVKIRNGAGEYISSISIDPQNDNKIIASISNYGAQSVLLTSNGGASWTNVEGNLPDMPVRCVIFDNESSQRAYVATEVGVWSTSSLSGASTRWMPTLGMDNVRVDMIIQRESDNQFFAATHGRGVFISDGSQPTADFEIQFAQSELDISETGEKLTESDCVIKFRTIFVPVTISGKPQSSVQIKVNDVSSASFKGKYEYEIKTPVITFPANSQTTRHVEVEVFDDYVIEDDEFLTLNLEGQYLGNNTSFTINVKDDDVNPLHTSGSSTFTVGSPNATMDYAPFRGYYEDELSQFIVRAEELKSAGIKAGELNGLKINVFNKRSNGSYDDVSIHLGNTQLSSFTSSTQSFESNLKEVFNNSIQLEQGENTFTFKESYTWDGASNIIVQICFNNDSWSLDDVIEAEQLGYNSTLYHYKDNTDGCTIPYGRKLGRERPIFTFIAGSEIKIAKEITSQGANLTKNELAFFTNEEDHLVSSVKNLNQGDLGCVEVEIDREGEGFISPSWMNGSSISRKSFYFNIENKNTHTVALYFSEEELGDLGKPSEIVVLRADNKVPSMTSNTFEEVQNTRYSRLDGRIHIFSFIANESGGYVLSNTNKAASRPFAIVDMSVIPEDEEFNQIHCTVVNNYGNASCELERSFNGFNFEVLAKDDAQLELNAEEVEIHFEDRDLIQKDKTYHYRVKVETAEGDVFYSNPQTVYIGGKSPTRLKVYPNPTFDKINIVLESKGSIDKILLRTMDGKTIANQNSNSDQTHIVLELNDLQPGIYILQVKTSEGAIVTKKVIKK